MGSGAGRTPDAGTPTTARAEPAGTAGSPPSIPAPSRPKASEMATHGRPFLAQSDLWHRAANWHVAGDDVDGRIADQLPPVHRLGILALFFLFCFITLTRMCSQSCSL